MAWTAVLAAMVLMPILPSFVPEVEVPLPVNSEPWVAEEQARVAEAPVPAVRVDDAPRPSAAAPAAVVHLETSYPAPARPNAIPLGLVVIYAAGVGIFLLRLAIGWRAASKMVRRAVLTQLSAAAQVLESCEVVTPVTAGILHTSIILPRSWTTWPDDWVRAVLEHESAHARRHDAIVTFIARMNRAVFWFHPLAWWLERKLALTSEHVCDEAAAVVVGEPRRYAEILVDMAEAVRANRGRVVWQGIGVDGAGSLGTRIDRVLRGECIRTSRMRKLIATLSCVAAILFVVACRQQITAAPLREDPELAKTLAEVNERTKRFLAARDMLPEQADALEARVAQNPEDFDAREQLVTYYRMSRTVAWDKKVPGLRRHSLWLIEHHPEHEVEAPPLSPVYDPQGFAAARRLWEAHLSKPDVGPYLISRAASFFAPHDKATAEQLLLRGLAMDPQSEALKGRVRLNVGGYQWQVQLAWLYGGIDWIGRLQHEAVQC